MLEAYAAVERSYSAGHFDQALAQAESLIAKLQTAEEQPMRLRLELLVGHCCLYGLAQPERAADCYRLVAEQSPEAVLREIALQGLERCAGSPQSSPSAPQAGDPAMPWLQQNPSGATEGEANPSGSGATPWQTAAAAVPELPEIEAPGEVQPERGQTPTGRSIPQTEPSQAEADELLIPELVEETSGAAEAGLGADDWSAAKDEEDLAQSLLLVEL